MLKSKRELEMCAKCDRVDVVRCRECKWFYANECVHKLGMIVAKEDGYCSYGEKKDNE